MSEKRNFKFSEDKDKVIRGLRGISFRDVINELSNDGIIDDIAHPNKTKYPHQQLFIIKIHNYIYAVPYVINIKDGSYFLKTVYPDRRLQKKYEKK